MKTKTIEMKIPVLTRKGKRLLKNLILKSIVTIAITNLFLLLLFIQDLTTEGPILAAIVNIPGTIFLTMFAWANGYIYINKGDKNEETGNVQEASEIEKIGQDTTADTHGYGRIWPGNSDEGIIS